MSDNIEPLEISPEEFINKVEETINLCLQNIISNNEMSNRLRIMVSKPLISNVLRGESAYFKVTHMAITADLIKLCDDTSKELTSKAGVFSFEDKKSAKLWRLAAVSLGQGIIAYEDFADKFCE